MAKSKIANPKSKIDNHLLARRFKNRPGIWGAYLAVHADTPAPVCTGRNERSREH